MLGSEATPREVARTVELSEVLAVDRASQSPQTGI